MLGLRQYLTTKSPLKMIKNAFYLIFKLFTFLRYLIFFPGFFGHVAKRNDKKATVNFKIYDVMNWETNIYNAHIAQYRKKYRQSDKKIWSVNRM